MIRRTGYCHVCGLELLNKQAYYCRSHAHERHDINEQKRRESGAKHAAAKVAAAIRRGDLPPIDEQTPCVDCGGRATEYDHRDYSRPLEVEPVCHRCNILRGPAIPASRCGEAA